jgi:coenzyme F420-reducing hydrogenase alpha subunit
VLAEQIDGDLRKKKRRHLFNNIALLAEFQVSIERAASVLDSIATLNYDQQEDTENGEKFARNAAWRGCRARQVAMAAKMPERQTQSVHDAPWIQQLR